MALVPFPSQNRSEDESENLPAKPGGFSPFGEDEEPAGEGRMTFLEHLDELRKRITHAVGGLLVGFILAFTFIDRVFAFVYQRLVAAVPGGKLIYTEPSEMFMLWIKIAALSGVLIASPYIMLQVAVHRPGFTRRKELAIPSCHVVALVHQRAACSHYMVPRVNFLGISSSYIDFCLVVLCRLYVKLMLESVSTPIAGLMSSLALLAPSPPVLLKKSVRVLLISCSLRQHPDGIL